MTRAGDSHAHTHTHTSTEQQDTSFGSCSEGDFDAAVLKLDPLSQGMPNRWATHLARSMLEWSPERRVSATRAMEVCVCVCMYVCVYVCVSVCPPTYSLA
jgi:hypothetical protein